MLCDKSRKTTLLQFESLEQVRQSVLSRIKQTVKDADVKKSVMDAVVSAKKDAKKELDKWDSKVSCLGRKKKKNQKKDSKKKKLKKEAKKKKKQAAKKKKKSKKRRRESTSSSSSSSSSDDNDEEDESDDKKDDDMEEDNESSDGPGSDDEKRSSKAKSAKSKGMAPLDRKEFWNKYQKAKTGEGEKTEHKSAPSVAPSSDGRGSGQVDDDLFANPRFSPQPSIPELQEDLKELLNAVENKYIALDSVTWLNLKWEMEVSVSSFFAMAIGNPLFDGWKNGLCESLGVCWCEAGWAMRFEIGHEWKTMHAQQMQSPTKEN